MAEWLCSGLQIQLHRFDSGRQLQQKGDTMYGIRVPLAVDDYIWVSDSINSTPMNPKPLLFKTKEEAYNHAKIWGPLAVVKRYKDLVL